MLRCLLETDIGEDRRKKGFCSAHLQRNRLFSSRSPTNTSPDREKRPVYTRLAMLSICRDIRGDVNGPKRGSL